MRFEKDLRRSSIQQKRREKTNFGHRYEIPPPGGVPPRGTELNFFCALHQNEKKRKKSKNDHPSETPGKAHPTDLGGDNLPKSREKGDQKTGEKICYMYCCGLGRWNTVPPPYLWGKEKAVGGRSPWGGGGATQKGEAECGEISCCKFGRKGGGLLGGNCLIYLWLKT